MNVNRAGEIAAHQRYWMIGSENDKFETLPDAFWSQFEMIIGEFPFAEGRVASFFEMFYRFSYAMLVFVLLINSFLLAVVVILVPLTCLRWRDQRRMRHLPRKLRAPFRGEPFNKRVMCPTMVREAASSKALLMGWKEVIVTSRVQI